MPKRYPVSLLVLATVVAVGACGEEEPPADISYVDVRAAEGGGAEAFEAHFATIRGKKVEWTGRVVEAIRQFGDDYAETGLLYVDMDDAGEEPAADVAFEIKPSTIPNFQPGQPVTFVGVIREFQREPEGMIIVLQAKPVE